MEMADYSAALDPAYTTLEFENMQVLAMGNGKSPPSSPLRCGMSWGCRTRSPWGSSQNATRKGWGMKWVSARGSQQLIVGVSASPGEKWRWRSNAVLGAGRMVPCSPDTSAMGTHQELRAMRGPHGTFSPGTRAGAEHGWVSPPPDPNQEKRAAKSF